MKPKLIINPIILFIICAFISGALNAAETETNALSDDNYSTLIGGDADMKPLISKREPYAVSYGGWIETAFMDDRSGNSSGTSQLTSQVVIGKVWLKTALPYNSYIYLRGSDIFNYYYKKPEGSDLETTNNIDLDAGFYSISTEDNTIRGSIGRKYYMLGTGLVFNGRGDGAEFNLYTRYVDVMIFGAYTGFLNKNTNPYRLSTQDFIDNGRRIFAGGTIEKSVYNQTFYLLGMYQTNINDDVDNSTYPDAENKYVSQYYGLGFKGTAGNAFYYGEAILELGTGYTDYVTTANEKKKITAFAAIAGLNYYLDIAMKPVLLLNYAYGSGDKDKKLTNSPTGNIEGNDCGFLYFGTFSGGYVLRPYLSNIHIGQAGFSLSPFNGFKSTIINRVNIIVKYSNYQKDKTSAPINRTEAVIEKRDIGHGIDLSLRWKIFSDFSFYTNFGMFIPGGAYSSGEKNRTFVMSGINLSF